MKPSNITIALIGISLAVSGCAGSSNLVVMPNTSEYRSGSVTLEYGGATVEAEDKGVSELKAYMEKAFFEKGLFEKGEGLTVRYGFMTYDEGSQAARYFLGGLGGGEAKMVVGAEFYDNDGQLLAKIQSEGRLSGGFFGGDASSAIEAAAKEVAEFAAANFAP